MKSKKTWALIAGLFVLVGLNSCKKCTECQVKVTTYRYDYKGDRHWFSGPLPGESKKFCGSSKKVKKHEEDMLKSGGVKECQIHDEKFESVMTVKCQRVDN